MNKRDIFFRLLPTRAASRIDRAILIVSYAKQLEAKPRLTLSEIMSFFEAGGLARPNSTILGEQLTSDKRVSFRDRQARPLHKADEFLKTLIPELFNDIVASPVKLDRQLLRGAPFIDTNYLDELNHLVSLYEALHVLENSIRRLIQSVLAQELGDNWWDIAASAAMKKKHKDRIQKEHTRKWLPARSLLGPLYSLDWSDLITLIRKYERQFLPFIGEIDFMHRYADLGLLRHVIAHHGFIDDDSEFDRIALALKDWNNQVAPLARREFGSNA